MAVTTVGEVLRRSKLILQEVTQSGTRWSNEELLGWLNESYQAIIGVKPDAAAENETMECVAGTKQAIPASGVRLLDVVRNMVSGMAIMPASRSALDSTRRRWHSEEPSEDVEQFIFDDADPRHFYVYPPAVAGLEIEIIYASVPAPHALAEANTESTEVIKLPDIYAPTVVDYILMRAYSKDADHAANLNRAQLHSNSYMSALGLAAQGEAAFSPNQDVRPGSVQ